MSRHTLSIAPGVILEHVGLDVVVMAPGSTEVIKLSGDVAHTIRAIQAGDVAVSSETVSELVERGIVVSQAGMSRRGLITAGALGAGAGVVMLSMPAAAAAGSDPVLDGGNGDVDDEDDEEDENLTTVEGTWDFAALDGNGQFVTRLFVTATGLPVEVEDGTWELTLTNVNLANPPEDIQVVNGFFSKDNIDLVTNPPQIPWNNGDPVPSVLEGRITKGELKFRIIFEPDL